MIKTIKSIYFLLGIMPSLWLLSFFGFILSNGNIMFDFISFFLLFISYYSIFLFLLLTIIISVIKKKIYNKKLLILFIISAIVWFFIITKDPGEYFITLLD
jgi:hypothetical protein